MSNHDDHYRDQKIEPIDIKESLIQRLVDNGVPLLSAVSIYEAQGYITRCSTKEGEPWMKEIDKAINYLTRALTGEWKLP